MIPADQESYTFQYASSLETLGPGQNIAQRTAIKKVDSAFKLSPGKSFVLTGLERNGRENVITQVLVVRLRGPAQEPPDDTDSNGLEADSSSEATPSKTD